ncbi:hypothetical protein Cgig2_007381 [Carnegiea gigantea]|uniref:Uncharacterized protein n=1 Tax=Carnegiea gigantea TaxID=171969 RepID=A0A9Q1KYH4_9CARY|nr:hypothetical protein Cgig2_007381 [Carnegiea gigantea]
MRIRIYLEGSIQDAIKTKELCDMRREASYGAFLHCDEYFFLELTSSGVPLLPRGRGTPIPFPLGYLKQLGLSSIAAAVATICINSASSDGAMTTMFGKQAIRLTEFPEPRACLELGQSTAESPNRSCRTIKSGGRQRNLLVVIQHDNEVSVEIPCIVQSLVCLPCSHGSISNH